ncbi:MAG TPA: hypothetical protein VEA80_16040 [Vitreimonas sp.]|uniref:hypothetical protein n=1 Tax=Vitreimonas sp. TaxID=3069702 RepID=UPI002D4555DE|nr:hypothetical protein [Vitreimonas sp.]HYD88987.1 hypothetical protein [Vitreimonas sp.]
MSIFPLAANLTQARAPDAPRARTEDEATTLAGGPVFLAVEELPDAFETPDAAEQAVPELYGSGLYELLWRDGAWRVSMRYWRPAPPAPVARTGEAAAKKPLGRARTPEEARALLEAPAELAREVLPNLYVDHKQLMKRWGKLVTSGLGEIVEREGKFACAITYWRPMHAPGIAAPLAPAERVELAERVLAPLRGPEPQAELDIGLFEDQAPENPNVVLVTEEGDGRFRGSE